MGRGSTNQLLNMENRRDRIIEQIVEVEIEKEESVRELLHLTESRQKISEINNVRYSSNK